MTFARLADRRNLRGYSPNDRIGTPRELFDSLDAEFHFTLDACATPDLALCPTFYTEQDNSLWQPWDGVVWCNPPYSNIAPWIRKAWEARHRGTTTVLLVPTRTDMGWWHDFVLDGAEIRFIRGRLRFEGQPSGAPFPVCVVIFRPTDDSKNNPLPLEEQSA